MVRFFPDSEVPSDKCQDEEAINNCQHRAKVGGKVGRGEVGW